MGTVVINLSKNGKNLSRNIFSLHCMNIRGYTFFLCLVTFKYILFWSRYCYYISVTWTNALQKYTQRATSVAHPIIKRFTGLYIVKFLY